MQKMDITRILKDKPTGTRLYSTIIGNVNFVGVTGNAIEISFFDHGGGEKTDYTRDGRYDEYFPGECILFPSYTMRDWEKFGWKRGDVLYCEGTGTCLFDEWCSDDYTLFYFKYMRYEDGSCCDCAAGKTELFQKIDDEERASYISDIEAYYGGKLNLDTLNIEKRQEFKDEDTKQIEDLPEKRRLKPFDRVLTRDNDGDAWRANIFSHMNGARTDPYPYVTIRDRWKQCIPYEGNEHLLGTIDEP